MAERESSSAGTVGNTFTPSGVRPYFRPNAAEL